MPPYLILAAGFLLGILAYHTAMVIREYLPSRPVAPAPRALEQEAIPRPEPEPEPTHEGCKCGAGDILGYNDLGGRWIAPTCPATRGAQNSMQARIAWDGRRRNAA